MGTEGSSAAVVQQHRDARPDIVESLTAQVERLTAELEQAHVLLEDMDDRLSKAAEANAQLIEQLKEQSGLRLHAEARIDELVSRERLPDEGRSEAAALRQELSVALEELQVMQEELQSAHDALSAAQYARDAVA